MVKDGILYALVFGAAGLACGFLLEPWTAAPWAAIALFCLYFFRDPDRSIPLGSVCVSPADGKVVQVRKQPDGRTRISVFLSIFDVHVNRAPIAGLVRSVRYSRGGFRLAHLEAASAVNEQNAVVIEERDGGSTVEIKQIAGLIARRIVCRVRRGDAVAKGERFGLIKFGSRVDVLLGEEWDIKVRRGDRVAGGSSVLANRNARSPVPDRVRPSLDSGDSATGDRKLGRAR